MPSSSNELLLNFCGLSASKLLVLLKPFFLTRGGEIENMMHFSHCLSIRSYHHLVLFSLTPGCYLLSPAPYLFLLDSPPLIFPNAVLVCSFFFVFPFLLQYTMGSVHSIIIPYVYTYFTVTYSFLLEWINCNKIKRPRICKTVHFFPLTFANQIIGNFSRFSLPLIS